MFQVLNFVFYKRKFTKQTETFDNRYCFDCFVDTRALFTVYFVIIKYDRLHCSIIKNTEVQKHTE